MNSRAAANDSNTRPAAERLAVHAAPPYRAPAWLRGGHLQTVVPALFTRLPARPLRRERWTTPDGDFIEADWLVGPSTSSTSGGPLIVGATHRSIDPGMGPGMASDPVSSIAAAVSVASNTGDAPLLVLFHGLEGNSASPYARVLMADAAARGWRAVVPHFRSCGSALNLAPRLYHSGDSAEIDWILTRLRRAHRGPLLVVGVSLGGNALLRWLGERGHAAAFVTAAAAISAPLDLHAGGRALSTGFNLLYTRNFLRTMKRKCLAKLDQYPTLFDRQAMLASRDLYTFDNIVTAPLHGYRNTDDYWRRASAKDILGEITVPTLLINARNDPFLPAAALPTRADVSSAVELDQPAHGGHVGFMRAPCSGCGAWLAQRVGAYFTRSLTHG